MAIEIRANGERFHLALSWPDVQEAWSPVDDFSASQVLRECALRGCDPAGVVAALDATGSDWRPLQEAEVARNHAAVRHDPRWWTRFLPAGIAVIGLIAMYVGTYEQSQVQGTGFARCDRSIPVEFRWPLVVAGGVLVALVLAVEAVRSGTRPWVALVLWATAIIFVLGSSIWAGALWFGTNISC